MDTHQESRMELQVMKRGFFTLMERSKTILLKGEQMEVKGIVKTWEKIVFQGEKTEYIIFSC